MVTYVADEWLPSTEPGLSADSRPRIYPCLAMLLGDPLGEIVGVFSLDPQRIEVAKQEREMSIAAIMGRLLHRHPFSMIDRVLNRDENVATAIKNVTINELYFAGHFPAEPIMPGMLIGESMAQTSAFIGQPVIDDDSHALMFGQRAFLTRINLKLIRPVVPGDQIRLTAQLVKRLGSQMRVRATAHVGRVEVASADLSVAMVSL